jgi:hypothetical protein
MQRLIVFIASPITNEVEELVQVQSILILLLMCFLFQTNSFLALVAGGQKAQKNASQCGHCQFRRNRHEHFEGVSYVLSVTSFQFRECITTDSFPFAVGAFHRNCEQQRQQPPHYRAPWNHAQPCKHCDGVSYLHVSTVISSCILYYSSIASLILEPFLSGWVSVAMVAQVLLVAVTPLLLPSQTSTILIFSVPFRCIFIFDRCVY